MPQPEHLEVVKELLLQLALLGLLEFLSASGKDEIICSGLFILSQKTLTGLKQSFTDTSGELVCSSCCKNGPNITPAKNVTR